MGSGVRRANFLNAGAQTSGLTVATSDPVQEFLGESGIIRWLNEGADSPITGAYPAEDTAIVDPPIWFFAVPASLSVDARLPLTNFFLSGMWHRNDAGLRVGTRLALHRSRDEHRRHGSDRQLRDEPALPGGSGARVAAGRRWRLLGGSVAPIDS